MNSREAQALTEKLNALITAADEFGTQSVQLGKVREDFDAYLSAVKTTDQKMADVIGMCEDYIKSAKIIVEQDMTEQISQIVSETEKSIYDWKKHCENLTSEYNSLLDVFRAQKGEFEEHQSNLVKQVEKDASKLSEDTQNIFKRLSEELVSVEKKLRDSMTELGEQSRLSSNDLSSKAERLQEKLSDIQQTLTSSTISLSGSLGSSTEKILSVANNESEKINTSLVELKQQLLVVHEKQEKNGKMILASIIVAAIAAVAAGIGLFI